jgi:hypothetical protein
LTLFGCDDNPDVGSGSVSLEAGAAVTRAANDDASVPIATTHPVASTQPYEPYPDPSTSVRASDASSLATPESDSGTQTASNTTSDAGLQADSSAATRPSSDDSAMPTDAGPKQDASEAAPPQNVAEEAGSSDPDAGNPFYEGAPRANTAVDAFDVDVFGSVGNRYWFATDPAQVQRMNAEHDAELVPNAPLDEPYVESLFVTTNEGATADFGRLEVRLVGESTYRQWTPTTLPNLRLDMDHFVQGLRLGGYEHLRLNNGVVGSIFREKLALDFHRMLGYPAASTQFAWVGSSVWGDAWMPYTIVQVYKKNFCAQYADEWGGGCENMWELEGDFGGGQFQEAESCQSNECDPTRVSEFEQAVLSSHYGEGFKAGLAGWLDWDAYHEFQCLAWILSIGDDAIHNNNNIVLVERSDGLFQYLPYSTDISLGHEWARPALSGQNLLSEGCQNDPSCWADTLATCERVIGEFAALDPVGVLNERYAELEGAGMLRDGDTERYEQLGSWLQARTAKLTNDLEGYLNDPSVCPPGQVRCEAFCMHRDECWKCRASTGNTGETGNTGDAGQGVSSEPPIESSLPPFCYP